MSVIAFTFGGSPSALVSETVDQNSYDDHALWPVLNSLQEMLAGDLAAEDAEHRNEIRLAHSVAQYVESLRGVDPGLVDEAILTSLSQNLTEARDYLTSYLQDRVANAGVLTSNAVASFHSVRNSAIQSMPPPPADEQARAAQEATNRYKRSADAEIATLREQVGGLKQRIAELDEQRTTDVENAQSSLTELQEKIAEGNQHVATQTTQLQEQIETQRTAFSEEAEQRESVFRESEQARTAAADEQREQQSQKATDLLSELKGYREQARGLIEATGRDAVSGDYQVWAKDQGKVAKWWNVAAVVVGLITVGALVWVVLGARNDTTQFLIAKSSVGIIGLIVAGYCGRQAAEHRAEERTAKRLGLDLAALEPFLENVDNPQELRVEIARRVFAPEPPASEDRRISLGRRGMSVSELTEFIKIVQNPPG